MIINLFCDASIDIDTKTTCGGCVVVAIDNNGEKYHMYDKSYIQLKGTNNSAEILAIWTGVTEALKLRQRYPGAIFRLYSDSKISLYGLRDWMKNWVAKKKPDGTLISSSGQPVMNQQAFIDIFNLIVENNLRIEFYHQRGHVTEGKVSYDRARVQFIRANKVPPEQVGFTIQELSQWNNLIDHYSRDCIYSWLNNRVLLPGCEIQGIIPMEYMIRDQMLHQYIRCIDKTTVVSRHDFKGGYSQ